MKLNPLLTILSSFIHSANIYYYMFFVYKLYVNYALLNALLLKPASFSGHSVSHPETPGFQLHPFWGIAFGSRELLCFLLRAAHTQWLVSEGDTKASCLASIWDNAEAHPSSRVQHFPPSSPSFATWVVVFSSEKFHRTSCLQISISESVSREPHLRLCEAQDITYQSHSSQSTRVFSIIHWHPEYPTKMPNMYKILDIFLKHGIFP